MGTAAKPESDAPCAFTYEAHESRTVLPNGVRLSVAAGGTFRVEGDALTVKELTIECSGGGAIENVDFASEGTLNFVNFPAEGGAARFSLTRVANFDRVGGWEVKIDGKVRRNRAVSVDGSTIRLVPRGTMLVVR